MLTQGKGAFLSYLLTILQYQVIIFIPIKISTEAAQFSLMIFCQLNINTRVSIPSKRKTEGSLHQNIVSQSLKESISNCLRQN